MPLEPVATFCPAWAWASAAWPSRRCCTKTGSPPPSSTRPPFRSAGEERHLAVHDRRHQPHGVVRSQAGPQPVRGQNDCGNAVRGRARVAVSRRTNAWSPSTPTTASSATSCFRCRSAIEAAGRERPGDQRLVAACRRVRRRPVPDPLDVDRRQQSRRAASVPHGPALASTDSFPRSARGSTTGWAR